MNEEQSEELLSVLRDIKEVLKSQQKVEVTEYKVKPEILERLQRFKTFVTSNEFYNTLSEKQQKQLLKLKIEV